MLIVQENSIIIFKPKVARQLLKQGHLIIDIKQHKDNKDKTVFVFDKTKKLVEDLNSIINNI